MGLLGRLLGREPNAERRGEDVAGRLDALAQLDDKWSTETQRRRVRDVFFAVEPPSWGRPNGCASRGWCGSTGCTSSRTR